MTNSRSDLILKALVENNGHLEHSLAFIFDNAANEPTREERQPNKNQREFEEDERLARKFAEEQEKEMERRHLEDERVAKILAKEIEEETRKQRLAQEQESERMAAQLVEEERIERQKELDEKTYECPICMDDIKVDSL